MNRDIRSDQTYGVVAFSFALRGENAEPNPCNQRLATNTQRAIKQFDAHPVVVAQWEVARALEARGDSPVHVVGPRVDKGYLGSEEVWDEAKATLDERGIRKVVLVAQPFLHLQKVAHLARADGYEVVPFKVRSVGFDSAKLNTQWWTRGPLRLLAYAVLQKLARFHVGRATRGRA